MSTKIKYGLKEMEEEFGPVNFAFLLKNFREIEEMSQKDFAALLKISPQRLNDFEKGRRLPDIESAIKFARILKDSEAFFIQILFQDYLNKENINWEVKIIKKSA
jgi:transcriptional regulator with XRE-family HTH domain